MSGQSIMPPIFESTATKIQVRNISSAIINSIVPYSAGEENTRLLRNIKVFITTYTTAYSLTLSGDNAVWSAVRLATLTALLLLTHVFWGVKLSFHVPKGFGIQCGQDRAVGIATRCGLEVRGSNPGKTVGMWP
jgi:hypothetical protein